MPLPLIPIVVVAAITALGTAAAVARWASTLENKTVLIVGPRHSGKTVLQGLLTRGQHSLTEIGRPSDTFDFSERKIGMEDLPWSVNVVDSPSTRGRAHELRERVRGADLVIFTADASLLDDDEYADFAESMATTLRLNADESTGWMLVMSHADLLPEQPEHCRDVDVVTGHERLAKILDESEPLACNFLAPECAPTIIGRVIGRLR